MKRIATTSNGDPVLESDGARVIAPLTDWRRPLTAQEIADGWRFPADLSSSIDRKRIVDCTGLGHFVPRLEIALIMKGLRG